MIEWANGQEAEYQGELVKIVGCCPDAPGEQVILHPVSGYIRVPTASLETRKVSLSGRFRVALMVSYSGNSDVPTLPYHAIAVNDAEAAAVAALPSFRGWLTAWGGWEKRVDVATP